jgi:hypothetical protein
VPDAQPSRDRLWVLLFLLLPAGLLGECLFGKRYLPYDLAEFPPVATSLTLEQQQALRQTANYDATEAPIWFAIEIQLAREALARGQLPHWNPYVRNGAPQLAHGHLGFLDPLHWPALLFPDPADGLLAVTWLMLALAGALQFGLLRALGCSVAAAVFGGVAFAWSGTLAANGHWFMRLEPLALLPGLWWSLLVLARRSGPGRAGPALGFALLFACTWLSGFPQYGVPTSLLAAGLGAWLCLRALRQGARRALGLAGWMLAAAGLGLLLASPSLVPMLQFYPLSNRPIDESLERASRHAFAEMGFLGYLFPALFSHPGDLAMPQDTAPLPWLWSNLRHWQTGAQLLPNYNFTEYAVFAGTLPLILAPLALLLPGPRWRGLAAAGLAALWLLATGAFGAWHAFLLPGLKAVPPYRCMGPACALVAMLAAAGFDALRAQQRPWLLGGAAVLLAAAGSYLLADATHPVGPTLADDPWLTRIVARHGAAYAEEKGVPSAAVTPAAARTNLFAARNPAAPDTPYDTVRLGRERMQAQFQRTGTALWLGAGVLLLAALRGPKRPLGRPLVWLLIAATAAELGIHGAALNRGQATPYPHDSAVHAFLRERRDAERPRGGFLVGRGAGDYGAYNLPGGTLAAEHIRDLNFYTFVDKWSDRPIRKLYGDKQILRGFVCDALPDDARLERPWWDLLGLRYVLATVPMQHAGARVGPELRGPLGEYYVYERPHALPRAYCVPAVRLVADEAALVEALVAADLQPRAAALVLPEDLVQLPKLAQTADASARAVLFVHEDSRRVVLKVDPGAPCYLVLADTFFPGWRCTVAGAEVPIARANLCQRLVALPAEGCAVEFTFRAAGSALGLWLGAAGALGIAVVLVWAARARALSAAAVRGPAG